MTRLQFERTRRGLTQMALGYLCGMAQSELSRIERGYAKPYPKQAARIAAALEVEADALLDDVACDPSGGFRAGGGGGRGRWRNRAAAPQ